MPPGLYVGIDLGTTFTGVAYASPPSKEIHIIRDWPGSDTYEPKVPTRLFYDREKLLGWGFADPRNSETHSGQDWQTLSVVERFKLEIDPSLEFRSAATSKSTNALLDTSRWYKDFLCCLYAHVEKTLQRLYPEPWSKEVEFTFTVPNLYGPHIIAKFREYISEGGFGTGQHHVSIVSLTESQAAIVYASHSLAIFKNNDLALVCDAGGGTTDCSLLRIVHEAGARLQMEEVRPAFGMCIGSTDIDNAIKDSYVSWLRRNAWGRPHAWPDQHENRQIEDYKIAFTTRTDLPLKLRIKHCPEVQISSEEVRSIFDVSIAMIFECVNAEMRLLLSAGMLEADNLYVVLCGGLGSSQYVRARLTDLFSRPGTSAIPHARIIDLPEPQLVVAKGLVAERIWGVADTWDTTRIPKTRPPKTRSSRPLGEPKWMGSKQTFSSGRPIPSVANQPTGYLSQSSNPAAILAPQQPSFDETEIRSALRNEVPPDPDSYSDLVMNSQDGAIKTSPNVGKSHGHILDTKEMLAQPWLAALDSNAPACIPTSWILDNLDDDASFEPFSISPHVPRIQRRPAQSIVQDSTHLSPGARSHTVASYSKVKLDAGQGVVHEASCDSCDKMIIGVRHKCLICPDWDYCSTCYLSVAKIHPGHRFASLSKPLTLSDLRPIGCLTCRKKRIECGGEFPICHNCVGSYRDCEGYSDSVAFGPSSSDTSPSSNPALHQSPTTSRVADTKVSYYAAANDELPPAAPVGPSTPPGSSAVRPPLTWDTLGSPPVSSASPKKLSMMEAGESFTQRRQRLEQPTTGAKAPHPPKSIFRKRLCRVSYGVLKLELYDESKHLRQDVWRFPLNNKLYVENIIEWVIKQGEEIDDEWTARFLCQKMLSNSERDDKKYIFQTHLVTSNKKAHQLPKSMTQGGAEALCNIEADLSAFPLSEFEKHVHKLGVFKRSKIYYLVKYHVAASSSPADIIFEVLFRGKSAEHRVERRVLWHDLSQPAPATLTPDVGSLSLAAG